MPNTPDEWAIPSLGPRDRPALEEWTPRIAARVAAMLGVVQGRLNTARSEALTAAALAQARADDAFTRSHARIAVSASEAVSVGSGTTWRSVGMPTQYATVGMRQSVTTVPGARSQIRFDRSGVWLVQGHADWGGVPSGGGAPTGIREAVIGLNGNGTLNRPVTPNTGGTAANPGGSGTLSTIIPASVGDHIELFVRQTQGVNVELLSGNGFTGTWLAASWLGPQP